MTEQDLDKATEEIAKVIRENQSFVLMSHVRPDGDAIGSQVALGFALKAAGKDVTLINEDGVPESLMFMRGADAVSTPPEAPIVADVAIALDTATKPRLGANVLRATAGIPLWLNIDHHISNPEYGDVNLIDATKPATGQIVYELIKKFDLSIPEETRDAIYVAVSTDTGSFQYSSTTAETYDMGADLIRRGLNVGQINSQTYDSYPIRRIELMRALLNTLEVSGDGKIAYWSLLENTKKELALQPDDSEGLIDIIRGVKGVIVAVFFEELAGNEIRVSMRSKVDGVNVCDVAMKFGGGGHALAAGIRMEGPIEEARVKVLKELEAAIS